MKEFYLVTTAIEATWPSEGPILFLGDWCCLYSKKNSSLRWRKFEIAEYHWDDRGKLFEDNLELDKIYEELLEELSVQFNELHGVNYSTRYWRILVGSWLRYFIEVVFDRWSMIEKVNVNYLIVSANVLDTLPGDKIPNDMQEFLLSYLDDAWNEAIFGELLQKFTSIKINKITNTKIHILKKKPAFSFRQRVRRRLIQIPSCLLKWVARKDDAFFISTYLPLMKDLILQLKLHQVPQIWRGQGVPDVKIDWLKREWHLNTDNKSGFSKIIREMIPGNIPSIYLEGYELLRRKCQKLPWPKSPKFIFTSNSFIADDIFKAWAAEKTELGAPLVIGQHGGGYGTMKWDSMERHQLKIANLWLSWGWSYVGNKIIKPVGNLKLFGRRWLMNKKGYALLVELTVPRYSYRMFSVPIAGQWTEYFEDQKKFILALPPYIKDQLLVRLYDLDRGWAVTERWRDFMPNIRIDEGGDSIESLVRRCRICISTYNSTTFLESMAMNIPTIAFWNERHWELNRDAKISFDILKTVGILHNSPKSAAQHLENIWDDVMSWWASDLVQAARKDFVTKYSSIPKYPLRDMVNILNEATLHSNNTGDFFAK
jgi:putative transferase (TIGR04331 family)